MKKNEDQMKKNKEIKNKKENKKNIDKHGKQESKKINKKPKKKMKLWKKIVLFSILAIIIGLGVWFAYKTHKNGGGMTGMLATVVGHDENTKKNLPELKVLILGVSTDLGDNAPKGILSTVLDTKKDVGEFQCLVLGISTDEEGALLTDTIMIASYNPNTQKANLLSIPRDTYIGKNKLKATPSDKINSLYSYGGAEKTLEAVNTLTGLDIKYYAVVKTEALIKLVDAIGEVEFNVPIDMKYDDPTQKLHINLKAGEQKINGEKAEQLLRFRKNNNNTSYPEEYGDNDTGRMRTQREFLMAVMQQTLKPGNVFKIGQILDIANKYLETNVDFSYIKDYIPYAVEFNTENLSTETIPGLNKELPEKAKQQWWFFEADQKETKTLIQNLFYDGEQNELKEGSTENTSKNTLKSNTISNSTNTNSSSKTLQNSDIEIEVLNGSGDSNKLTKAVEILKENGYDVTKTGKTTSISKTIITNKKELETDKVKEIKNLLGVGSISNKKNLSSKVHLTIVIGKDFNE